MPYREDNHQSRPVSYHNNNNFDVNMEALYCTRYIHPIKLSPRPRLCVAASAVRSAPSTRASSTVPTPTRAQIPNGARGCHSEVQWMWWRRGDVAGVGPSGRRSHRCYVLDERARQHCSHCDGGRRGTTRRSVSCLRCWRPDLNRSGVKQCGE